MVGKGTPHARRRSTRLPGLHPVTQKTKAPSSTNQGSPAQDYLSREEARQVIVTRSSAAATKCDMATGRQCRNVLGKSFATYPFTLIRNDNRHKGTCYADFFLSRIFVSVSATSISAVRPALSAYSSL